MTLTELPRRIRGAVPTMARSTRRPDRAASLPHARGGGLGRGLVAMRHPNYRRYWFGQIGSLIGVWMQSVALPWLVLSLGGTPLQLGLVMAFLFGPSMIVAPLGGVLADRVDKRRTLIIVNAVAMLQASVLFGLTATGGVEIWHVYALALVAGVVGAIEMPLRQAFVAELVPREDLVNAIALSSTSFNLSRVIGPAVAGVTIAVFGVASNFGVNALSYVSVIIGLLLVEPDRLYRARRPEVFPSVRASLAEGLRYAKRTPTVLWPLVLLGGVAALAMNFQTLLPLFSRDALGMDAGGYGALFAAIGVGSLAGSLGLAFMSNQRPMKRLILGGAAAFLVLTFALGFARSSCRRLPARHRHRPGVDADDQHDQRHDPEQRPRCAPRTGDGAVRDRLRRQRTDRRPPRRFAGAGVRGVGGVQHRCRGGGFRPRARGGQAPLSSRGERRGQRGRAPGVGGRAAGGMTSAGAGC